VSAVVILASMLGVLGLAIGSFLNVVVYRVPAGMSVVHPRSACPGCGHEITARDNVPLLSWMLLRGKCRSCHAPISVRYPIVELVGAVAFVGVALWVVPGLLAAHDVASLVAGVLRAAALLWLAAITIALAIIDVEAKRLPDSIVLPSYAVAAPLLMGAAAIEGDWIGLARIAAASGIAFALFFILWFIRPDGMGVGDVKLAGVLGLYLGAYGWEHLIVGLGAGFLLGGVFSMVLIVARRAGRKTVIPYGPWLLAGAWVGICAGQIITNGYLRFTGLG
jgi:leader peptidase (prepilin peptidase) / N-methyltransferase